MLNLSDNIIKNEKVIVEKTWLPMIFNGLKFNISLTKLNISNNLIGQEETRVIFDALKFHNSLTALDISNNLMGKERAISNAFFLKSNTSLTELNIASNKIGKEWTTVIFDALKFNKSLRVLNLSNNTLEREKTIIVTKWITAIFYALKSNNSLTTLDISNNLIGREEAIVIFNALKFNKSLTELNISYNLIEKEWIEAAFNALKFNNSLRVLNLSNNKIGEKEIVITDTLKSGSPLNELDITNNSLQYFTKIEEKIQYNNIQYNEQLTRFILFLKKAFPDKNEQINTIRNDSYDIFKIASAIKFYKKVPKKLLKECLQEQKIDNFKFTIEAMNNFKKAYPFFIAGICIKMEIIVSVDYSIIIPNDITFHIASYLEKEKWGIDVEVLGKSIYP
ncbi:leucine-rich repeat domain-containing protein [Rickettsia bellii]|uniref:Leucine Rich repeat family protein n=1 Tax=Rickettsia bellii str. RML Mogi TaxID=1359194 RepID=A0A0F3QJ90_RICBE|nr:hypothetical protein [Rickettsia bellii]KJV91504.1 leucine Rich repeat family protein [Rickettsia bellii str. RML Mogi]